MGTFVPTGTRAAAIMRRMTGSVLVVDDDLELRSLAAMSNRLESDSLVPLRK
jgi:hypothetical protein